MNKPDGRLGQFAKSFRVIVILPTGPLICYIGETELPQEAEIAECVNS